MAWTNFISGIPDTMNNKATFYSQQQEYINMLRQSSSKYNVMRNSLEKSALTDAMNKESIFTINPLVLLLGDVK